MNNSNSLNFIDDCLKILGYEKDESSSKAQANNDENPCKNFDSDSPWGFQDIDPFFFIVTAEIMGDVLAGFLPFNTANQIANIMNMVGQVLETYAAQLAYFEGGPGNFFDPNNRNRANLSCPAQNINKETIEKLNEEVKKLDCQLNKMQERIQQLEGRKNE